MTQPNRRLAAILAADVAGYSRLMGEDEAGTLAALRRLRGETFEPLVADHHGNVVKRMGDGWLVEFASVVDAVTCARQVQQKLAGDAVMRLRIGIHTGDIVHEDEDIYGDGVNIAARLQELAPAGGIALSDTARKSLDRTLSADFTDQGEHELKNIAEPVRVFSFGGAIASGAAPALPEKPSIAVLPFDNMSPQADQEHFADGITEDLITALSKFRSFFVIARNSSFTYKGRAVETSQVGRELGVRYILEGSVRTAGQRIRITAQLVEAETGKHIWAERYDRQQEDIFDVQDEITTTIAGTIAPEIGNVERERAARARPDSLEAWGLLQRGLSRMWTLQPDDLAAAVELFEAALARDENSAQTHSYYAFTLMHQIYLGHATDRGETRRRAAAHANRALELDFGSSLAHAVLARMFSEARQYDDSVDEAQKAVDLNPNHAFAQFSLAVMLVWANRPAEALEPVERAIRLSPNEPFMPTYLLTKGWALAESGRLDEGLRVFREACRIPHSDYRVWLFRALLEARAGDLEEAREAAAKVLELMPDFTIKRFREQLYANWHPAVFASFVPDMIAAGLPEE